MKRMERRLTILRDNLLWLVGVSGIVHQEVTGLIQAELLLVYMGILAIPGTLGIIALQRGGTDGRGSPLESQEVESSEP